VRHQRRLERAAAQRAVVAAGASGDVHALAQAVEAYLERALQLPVKGMTRDRLADALRERRMTDAVAAAVLGFVDSAEAVRFAPPALRGDGDLAQQAGNLVEVIEREVEAGEAA
jgi:hypothetical protein